ncbi:MAG TPA: thioredoxin family protein [Thermoanaerobaculia bacterium]|jgi:thiol-disulfide isomerase/thioredoxin
MRSIRDFRRASLGLLAATVLLAAAQVSQPAAAQIPADEVLKNFEIVGDYEFELAGETLKHAEIYYSQRAVAYLVMAPALESPLMISPRSRAVESVHLMSVLKRDDGTVDILADAQLEPVGPFELDGTEVRFALAGDTARLKPKPWLLGLRSGDELGKHNPEYAVKAAQYVPNGAHVERLRALAGDVRVRVYFGSWCPVCKRYVPAVMRLEKALAGSSIELEYYGLPQPMTEDPESERAGVHGVPTAVVFVDGKQVGQLSGQELAAPEAALIALLDAPREARGKAP